MRGADNCEQICVRCPTNSSAIAFQITTRCSGRRHETLSTRLAAPLVRFGVPISVMGLLLKGGLSSDMLQAAGLAVFAMGLVLVGAARLPGLAELASPTLRLGSCTGNTAYFGVPLALAFLPDEALPISIGYDLGATLLV